MVTRDEETRCETVHGNIYQLIGIGPSLERVVIYVCVTICIVAYIIKIL